MNLQMSYSSLWWFLEIDTHRSKKKPTLFWSHGYLLTSFVRAPWSQYSITMQRWPRMSVKELMYLTIPGWWNVLRMSTSSRDSGMGFWAWKDDTWNQCVLQKRWTNYTYSDLLNCNDFVLARVGSSSWIIHLVHNSKGSCSQPFTYFCTISVSHFVILSQIETLKRILDFLSDVNSLRKAALLRVRFSLCSCTNVNALSSKTPV